MSSEEEKLTTWVYDEVVMVNDAEVEAAIEACARQITRFGLVDALVIATAPTLGANFHFSFAAERTPRGKARLLHLIDEMRRRVERWDVGDAGPAEGPSEQ